MTHDDEDELDGVFKLLANRRRRGVIEVLRTVPGGRLGVSALADAVASRSEAATEDITAPLYHSDLPKLSAVGVIAYDDEDDVVEYDSNPLLERCLDVAESHRSDDWVYRSTESY